MLLLPFLLFVASLAGEPPGRLSVEVLDAATGEATPVRVRLVDEQGRAVAPPDEAVGIMYGHWDHADGYDTLPDSSYYVDGRFDLDLPPGRYTLTLTKGYEYVEQRHELVLAAGDTLAQTMRLERWIDPASRGWYSADGHIHIRRSPREDPLIATWTQAEDVRVGVLLWMGDFWATYYAQYAWGEEGVYREDEYLLTSGQEDPRTPELGHALGMGASDRVRNRREYYYYDQVFDRIRQLGGVAGYAHQGETFHGYRGLTLDGLRSKVDVVELLQFCADGGPLITEHYYQLLDLGFEATAVAGSDFPWCGRDHRYGFDVPREGAARIGNARFYTYVEGPLTYASWKAGLAAGRTFVSSGPVVSFSVDGHLPGDRYEVAAGTTVRVSAQAFGHPDQVPLRYLEIVGHGEVIRRVEVPEGAGAPDSLVVAFDLPVDRGIWLAARVGAGPTQFAHTTPVYVTAGGGFHNPETVEAYLDLSEQYLRDLEQVIATPSDDPERQAWRYREGLQTRIDETRSVIHRLRETVKR